ncbi:MAG: hypothetical protein J7J98_07840 [candidate division Zixibacteria bacterium]|nr:hypothetical protein [candidate division Zixibacteria bacterium]
MMRSKLWLLSAILVVCLAEAGTAQEVFERRRGIFETETITVAMPINPTTKVVIASTTYLSGDLTITSSESDSLRVVYKKVAKTSSKSEAIDYIDLISVVLEDHSDNLVVKLRSPNPAPWSGTNNSGRVEAEIFVPLGTEVEISAQIFDVTVNGPIRGIDIPNSLGRLDITGITEHLYVVTANRRISLTDITGEISATTTNSSLIAKAITTTDSQARFRNDGGDIKINGLIGSINARNSFGRITIEGFEPRGEISYIRGTSGPVAIEISSMGEGQVVVTNRHEDIDISVPDSLSAFFSLSVDEDGIIEVNNFSFTPDLVQRSRLSLQSGDGLADIRGSVKGSGNIYVRGRTDE